VWINGIESGEVPLVVIDYKSSVDDIIAPSGLANVVDTHVTSGDHMQICTWLVNELK
jgi:hypothetical protein